jgi:hypothetical protein
VASTAEKRDRRHGPLVRLTIDDGVQGLVLARHAPQEEGVEDRSRIAPERLAGARIHASSEPAHLLDFLCECLVDVGGKLRRQDLAQPDDGDRDRQHEQDHVPGQDARPDPSGHHR